jgi:hypothetical protein
VFIHFDTLFQCAHNHFPYVYEVGLPNARACGTSPRSEKHAPGNLEHVYCLFDCLDGIFALSLRHVAGMLPLFGAIVPLFRRYVAAICRYLAAILLQSCCYFVNMLALFVVTLPSIII